MQNFFRYRSPLHAFMCGLQGVNPARCVKVPRVIAINRTVRTAIGRRRQLFSPSRIEWKKNENADAYYGTMRRAGVSIEGGKSETMS